jgi:hypothetical protein
MADLRRELEQMRNRIKSLEQKNKQYERTARSLRNISPYQSSLVKADEDILPDEEGKCISMYRMAEGSSPYLKLKQRPVIEFKVYNHRKTPIWKDEEFHIARDVWGDYYRISGSDRDGIVSFFLTPEDGIPAAEGNQCFSSNCLRHYFDVNTSEIKPLEDPDSGGFVFDDVFNHTYGPVEANTMIQAKKIDGAWFVDVEPCPPLEEEDG